MNLIIIYLLSIYWLDITLKSIYAADPDHCPGQRIKCYSCSSVDDSHCNDPFDKQHQQSKPFPLVDCNDYCFKWAFQDTDGQKQLIRNCSTSLNIKMEKYLVCITESRSSIGYLCFCNKDKCNHSSIKSILNRLYHCLFVLFFINYFLL